MEYKGTTSAPALWTKRLTLLSLLVTALSSTLTAKPLLPHPVFKIDGRPTSVAVGDLDGDGHQDFAATSSNGDVFVLLGDGEGSFGSATRVRISGGSPNSATLGDLNEDGLLDLVVAISSRNEIRVRIGMGDGTFAPEMRFSVVLDPESLPAVERG